jgi:hypothetical protein
MLVIQAMHSCGMQISIPQLTNIVYVCLMGAELLVALVFY